MVDLRPDYDDLQKISKFFEDKHAELKDIYLHYNKKIKELAKQIEQYRQNTFLPALIEEVGKNQQK